MKTVKTKKGSELPLINLKGKDYLMVAYRLQWLTEDVESYTIKTRATTATPETATVEAEISIFDTAGKLVKSAMARKTESKAQFGDFEEKAETGAIGRALAMLGFGTQHAIADLDEGDRIVDSPVTNTKTARGNSEATLKSKAALELEQKNKETKPAEISKANGKVKPTFKQEEAIKEDW